MKRKVLFFIIITIITVTYTLKIVEIIKYPEEIKMTRGSNKELDIVFPFSVKILEDKGKIFEDSKSKEKSIGLNIRNNYSFKSVNSGIVKLEINLFDLVSVKKVNLNVVKDRQLIPGGEALGLNIHTKGVLVVKTSEIEGEDGEKYNPASDAGIKIGDLITHINDTKVKDAKNVIEILNKVKGRDINVVLERNNRHIKTQFKPVKNKKDNSYKSGIWVRDKTNGIGTLTFYDEDTNKFGALGHSMTDASIGKRINSDSTEIMKAKISSIKRGEKGSLGEITGVCVKSRDVVGDIELNTNFGVFGDIRNREIKRKKKSFPVALQNEVKTGKAYILSTIENDKVEEFEVKVIKVKKQCFAEAKSIIIEVTDKRLLNKTGGIVRGMSGSPIIQNGKIIGAITHVFVNNPIKGYGIFIEWMLKESDALYENDKMSQSQKYKTY